MVLLPVDCRLAFSTNNALPDERPVNFLDAIRNCLLVDVHANVVNCIHGSLLVVV